MALLDILKTIYPLSRSLRNTYKEPDGWKRMIDNLDRCLKDYKLHVSCVSGEANVLLYYYKMNNYQTSRPT